MKTAAKGSMRISKAGTCNKSGPEGFTLLELIVTLLLIAIILSFTLPKIGNVLYSTDLKKSVRQLRALLTVARSKATTEGIPRRIVCDISKGEIYVEREVRHEEEGLETVRYEADPSILIHRYTLPPHVAIEDVITETGEKQTEGKANLRIGVNGMIFGNRIHLTQNEEQYTLVINPLTGRVTVEEGYTEEILNEETGG